MKRIIGFAVTALAAAALFAAARPSLDGRALVADAGTMPKGLFARTVGYLPGDSVSVTNPATGSTVDVLVLGAVDPSEGVAILLSPEAAEQLHIKKNANVQVKITKRTGSLDETVSGTAVLAEGENVIADEPSAPVVPTEIPAVAPVEELAEATPADAPMPSLVAEEFPADASVEEVAEALPADDPVPSHDAEKIMADALASVPEVEEYTAPVVSDGTPELMRESLQPVVVEYSPYPSDDMANINVIVKEVVEKIDDKGDEAFVAETMDSGVDAYLADLADSLRVVDAIPALPEAEDDIPEYAVADYAEPEVAVEEPLSDRERVVVIEYVSLKDGECEPEFLPDAVETVAEAEYVEVPAEVTDYEALVYEEVTEIPVEAEVVVEYAYEPETVSEYLVYEETEVAGSDYPLDVAPAFEEVARSETETHTVKVEPEDAVAENVPSAEEPPVEKPFDGAYQPIVLVPAAENPPEHTPVAEEAAPAVAAAEPGPKSGIEGHVVPSLKELVAGAYYVQISSLSRQENIEAVLNTYADKYPMVVVPLASGASYQVLVGPLGVDEYSAVQAKFKAFGFKDAFLRKIKG